MVTPFSTPVRDYMSKSLIAVRPDTPLDEVLDALSRHDVSCVAVTEEDGALRGIVSMTDLLRGAEVSMGEPGEPLHITAKTGTASALMRAEVVTLDEGRPVRDAAELMVRHRIHRVVTTREGRAVGVLSTRDMMRAVIAHHIEQPLSAVMTTPVETISVGEPMDTAIARLGAGNFRGLVVVEGSYPVGVFTQTEALAARALPPEVRSTPVDQVMSYELICVDAHTPLYRAAGQAIATRARRILAVEVGKLCGILTGFDLARIATMES